MIIVALLSLIKVIKGKTCIYSTEEVLTNLMSKKHVKDVEYVCMLASGKMCLWFSCIVSLGPLHDEGIGE